MTQEELKARADAYIGHPYELGEDASVTSKREAYIKGYEDSSQKAWDFICEHWRDGFFDKNDFLNYMKNA